MSTRRARIKAVTSLPPRRKNVDNSDKTKPVQAKDEPTITKSPRTPRSLAKESPEISSRHKPGLLPQQSTPNLHNKIASPIKRPETPKCNISRTPKAAEKVSVITSTSASIKSLFASPPPRINSPSRNTASPIVTKLTPRIIKHTTPVRDKPNLEVRIGNGEYEITKNIHEKENSRADNKSDVPDGEHFLIKIAVYFIRIHRLAKYI